MEIDEKIEEILKKLDFSAHSVRFVEEKISPDIVCKLSVEGYRSISSYKRLAFLGDIMLRELLKGRGFNVERYSLRNSIHRVNDLGVQARKKGRLKRRASCHKLKSQITYGI